MNTRFQPCKDTKITHRHWLRFCLPLVLACVGFSIQSRAETTGYSGGTQITTLPMTITTSGTYYFAQNFNVNLATTPTGSCIYVNVSGVTIDLNGHTLANTSASNSVLGIGIADKSNVTIRNGTIKGFYYGIHGYSATYTAASPSFGNLVENVSLIQNTNVGGALGGFGCRFFRCRAVLTGSNGASVFGFWLYGTGSSVEDCEVIGKTGTGVVYGCYVTNGGDNFVVNNRFSGIEYGIYYGASGVYKYRDNLTSTVTVPYSGGTNAGNNN